MLRAAAVLSVLLLMPEASGAGPSDGIAFPGADGFGAVATGWKGGEIHRVSSLADDGPGSLRTCAASSGQPRICVFSVSGTIELRGPIKLPSNIYVAGQTAPGDGIQLRLVGGKHGPLILKNVNDVVVRHLKVRPGPSPTPSPSVDAITVENGQRIYLGNLSMAFATDETFNVHVSGATAADITLADSILAYSLDRSNHPKGRHSKGALICSTENVNNGCGRISLHRNLFAHHRDRQPDVKGTSIGPVEVINNVFYNPVSQFGEFYDLIGDAKIAYLGNVALSGPNTIRKTPEAVQVFEWEDAFQVELLAEDNIATSAQGCRVRQMRVLDPIAQQQQVAAPGWQTNIVARPAAQTLSDVLAIAGDQIPGRRAPDALDQRVVSDVRNCGGAIINEVTQVGGWPSIASADPASQTDSDGDGFPDLWEAGQNGLDPNEANDPWEANPQTGLSHVETWLAALAGDGS
ncbi:hypothetical protein [uncultured Roseobacter sp.]|uniref:pectate lyase family protein n=1 Tax=uncultured Roseobacter sp. TaxID=114847 RepID=UPI002624CED0|nr:hypothetical protein [uncultured Roseobacter sp.]